MQARRRPVRPSGNQTKQNASTSFDDVPRLEQDWLTGCRLQNLLKSWERHLLSRILLASSRTCAIPCSSPPLFDLLESHQWLIISRGGIIKSDGDLPTRHYIFPTVYFPQWWANLLAKTIHTSSFVATIMHTQSLITIIIYYIMYIYLYSLSLLFLIPDEKKHPLISH